MPERTLHKVGQHELFHRRSPSLLDRGVKDGLRTVNKGRGVLHSIRGLRPDQSAPHVWRACGHDHNTPVEMRMAALVRIGSRL
jgi:hypothetical protein